MATDAPIAAGDLLAVTGANGFVGAHVVAAGLRHGLRVRAIVRDADDPAKRAPIERMLELLEVPDEGRLSYASGDLLTPGSYDDAIAGADAVAHVAAVARLDAPDPQRQIVDPSLRGVENVYAAARKAGTVRRVAHTSSVAAVMRVGDARRGHTFGAADWNTESTLERDPYGFAKAAAERRAWELVRALPEDERFGLVVLNPAVVLGRVATKAQIRSSPVLLRDLLVGRYPACPPLHIGMVDAEDVAEAHIQALLQPDAQGRYILCAEQGWLRDLAVRIATLYPQYRVPTGQLPVLALKALAKLGKGVSASTADMAGVEIRYDASRSRDELGLRYTALDETVRRTVDTLIDGGWARPKVR